MTRQKTFKRDVRARMQKTGERYTAARRQLLGRAVSGDEPAAGADAAASEPGSAADARSAGSTLVTSEEALERATGRGSVAWFELLDEWGATRHSHTDIARWLVAEHGVPGWWAQSITVGYERARGLRQVHQTGTGFTVAATKTIATSIDRLSDAFTSDALRRTWLPDAPLERQPSRSQRVARFAWADDGSVVIAHFDFMSATKSRVAIEHARLPDAASAERMKAYWRERLAALKSMLESPLP